VWETYQKQILLIPTDNDCFVVEGSSQALRIAIQVKEGCSIENTINHIPGASPGTFHCSLIDGLGFEARSRWADSFGRDMRKCQRTIP